MPLQIPWTIGERLRLLVCSVTLNNSFVAVTDPSPGKKKKKGKNAFEAVEPEPEPEPPKEPEAPAADMDDWLGVGGKKKKDKKGKKVCEPAIVRFIFPFELRANRPLLNAVRRSVAAGSLDLRNLTPALRIDTAHGRHGRNASPGESDMCSVSLIDCTERACRRSAQRRRERHEI